jgi:hypothetical protein
MEKADDHGSDWMYGAESDFDEADAPKSEI